eukprot:13283-Heterococcus_DN1.PRE.2
MTLGNASNKTQQTKGTQQYHASSSAAIARQASAQPDKPVTAPVHFNSHRSKQQIKERSLQEPISSTPAYKNLT